MATSKDSAMIPPPPAEGPSAPGGDRIDPMAMTVAQAAAVLSAVGVGRVSEEVIRRHIAAGAPVTADGRVNLVHYAAWLNQRMGPDGQDKDEHGA